MRILSKYKDYYDYLQGIYGIDNLVVLDRTEGFVDIEITFPPKNKYKKIVLCICDKEYQGLLDYKGNFHWGDSIIDLPHVKKAKKKNFGFLYMPKYSETKYKFSGEHEDGYVELTPQKTEANQKKKCPILLAKSVMRGNYSYSEFPKLETYKIASILSPEKIWVDIYSWISKTKEEQETPEVPDKEKVINKGFDKTWSFRNRKNKKDDR
jgi:hypothetical protein